MLTAGIHEVFRGSNFFSNAGVGEINKNLNIEYNGSAPMNKRGASRAIIHGRSKTGGWPC